MLSALFALIAGAPAADKVTSLPGFASWPFDVYSGYLNVPGPFEVRDRRLNSRPQHPQCSCC